MFWSFPVVAGVALRKESVDRNGVEIDGVSYDVVALRKESVDRNLLVLLICQPRGTSLSARRAWIEMVLWYLHRPDL